MKEIWENRYTQSDYVYGTGPNEWFRQFIDGQKPGKILMAAEGEGRNAVYAAQKGWQVSAFDLTEAGPRKAASLALQAGVTIDYITADAQEVNYPANHFDALGIIFFHLPDSVRRHIFNRLSGFVRPGGFIVLECFSKKHFGNTRSGPKTIDLLYEPAAIRDDFADLEMVVFEEARYTIDEGALHQGPAEVIRLIALKK